LNNTCRESDEDEQAPIKLLRGKCDTGTSPSRRVLDPRNAILAPLGPTHDVLKSHAWAELMV